LQQQNQTNSQNIGAFQKNKRIREILADFQNIGGIPKYWRIPEI
jgi:hypothetical protein